VLMKSNSYSLVLTLTVAIALSLSQQVSLQTGNAMGQHPSTLENETAGGAVQSGSSQSGSGTVEPNRSGSGSSQLGTYPDKPLSSVPTRPVSVRFVVEHRSALNGKTITVKGIVSRTVLPSAGSTSTGEPSMSNPQPRIFLAENLRKHRDKNFDLIVLLREGESGYTIGQAVKIKVRVDSTLTTVMMRKVS